MLVNGTGEVQSRMDLSALCSQPPRPPGRGKKALSDDSAAGVAGRGWKLRSTAPVLASRNSEDHGGVGGEPETLGGPWSARPSLVADVCMSATADIGTPSEAFGRPTEPCTSRCIFIMCRRSAAGARQTALRRTELELARSVPALGFRRRVFLAARNRVHAAAVSVMTGA